MTTEIAIATPQSIMRLATDVAGVCREIVTMTARVLGGRKFLAVEAWQAIATTHGCALSIELVEKVEGGIRAVASVRRMDTGAVLGQAEGFVGDDEKTWGNRAMYAKRAMAQTRAMSRAARSLFAHVVVLISNDLSTTPAEEMEEESSAPIAAKPSAAVKPRTVVPDKVEPAPAPTPTQEPAQPPAKASPHLTITTAFANAVNVVGRDKAMLIMNAAAGVPVQKPADIPADKQEFVIMALQGATK